MKSRATGKGCATPCRDFGPEASEKQMSYADILDYVLTEEESSRPLLGPHQGRGQAT
jgi:hypothetical protein